MNRVTIILPVSRKDYVDRIFAMLELLECDVSKTNLLVIVDGDNQLLVNVRNKVEMSRFNERLCFQFKSKHKTRHFDILGRRMRISDIHNKFKDSIKDCDYVFGIEDDTIVPTNSLIKLIKAYGIYPHAGFIQGVELGRWGIPYIGAWKIDDIYETTKIESTELKEGLHEIDAGGFYCFMTKKDNYLNHFFKPFGNNDLGPDVDFGISLRKLGLLNYCDYSIKCTHKTKHEDITFSNSEISRVSFIKRNNQWRQNNKK